MNKYQYKVPIIWADTSLVIDMAHALYEPTGDSVAKERGKRLYAILETLTQAGKLVYLDAHQRKEYGLRQKLLNECDRMQSHLSCGSKLYHPYHTELQQKQRMMRYYNKVISSFELEGKDIFHSDPLERLESRKKTGIDVSVRFTISDKERTEQNETKDKITSDWEALRKAKLEDKMTFEQALDLEYRAEEIYYRDRLSRGLPIGTHMLPRSWVYSGGGMFDANKFFSFLSSSEYRSIPCVDISAHLLASMSVSDSVVKKGDQMDANQLSIILPYCSAVITDGAMKNRLSVLGLDRKYQTSVFSLREKDVDELFCYLDQL